MKRDLRIIVVCLLSVVLLASVAMMQLCLASNEARTPSFDPLAHPPVVRGFMSGHIKEGHFRDMRAFGANKDH